MELGRAAFVIRKRESVGVRIPMGRSMLEKVTVLERAVASANVLHFPILNSYASFSIPTSPFSRLSLPKTAVDYIAPLFSRPKTFHIAMQSVFSSPLEEGLTLRVELRLAVCFQDGEGDVGLVPRNRN